MKRTLLSFMALICLSSSAFAGTPTLDGTFDGASVWGSPIKTADGTAGWQGVNVGALYITSDANFIYLGATVTGAANWMDWGFAIHTQAGGSGSEVWGRNVTYTYGDLPDLVIKGHFGNGGAGYCESRAWSGSAWTQGSMTNNFAEDENAFVEVKIPASLLPGGQNAAGKVQFYVCGNNGTNGVFDACPNATNVTGWDQASVLNSYADNAPLVLPIELVKFSATNNTKTINLDWTTYSDNSRSVFEVERSADARNFVKIGQVAASKNVGAAKNYAFVDESPSVGINYYRLKWIDDDNGKTYNSKVISANNGDKKASLALSPNPAKDFLSVALTADREGAATVQIVDMLGRTVLTEKRALAKGDNSLTINVSQLSNGTYMLYANGSLTKFQKQ